MKTGAKRSRREAAAAIGAECGGMSVRTTLRNLDDLEAAGLIVPIDDYAGGVFLPDLGAVVKYW